MLLARRRLVFDEFFLFSLAIQYMKTNNVVSVNENVLEESPVCEELIRSLPYSLTNAQLKVWEEIKKDVKEIGRAHV